MNLTHKAKISEGYRWRLGIIAIAALAFGAYCVYDGAIAYPHQKEVAEAYAEVKQTHKDKFQAAWEARVQAEGWDVNLNETPKGKSTGDIITQYVMAVGCGLIALPFLWFFIHSYLRWYGTDARGLHAHGGRHAAWDEITKLDKGRWKSKGIAVVHYSTGGGEKTITLDDWKFHTDPTRAILREVEAHIDESRIDGEPEKAEVEGDEDVAAVDAASLSNEGGQPTAAPAATPLHEEGEAGR